MKCDCGAVMYWRCTNNITNTVKYKCPICGMVKTKKAEPRKKTHIRFKAKNRSRNYHKTSNGFEVKKYVRGKQTYFCRTRTEEQAKKIVELLRECDWDKSHINEIKQKVMG